MSKHYAEYITLSETIKQAKARQRQLRGIFKLENKLAAAKARLEEKDREKWRTVQI